VLALLGLGLAHLLFAGNNMWCGRGMCSTEWPFVILL